MDSQTNKPASSLNLLYFFMCLLYVMSQAVFFAYMTIQFIIINFGGRCGRDRKVVGFTTTCVISAHHH